ncbi:MAG TPA: ATP synthase subunit I [Coleofasciculaceae cyanobacterium]|jgi:hypothetical protein
MKNYYPQLKRRLWIGSLLVDAVLVAVVAVYWPELMKHLLFGIALGMFYLWSLFFNAEHPKNKIQFAFSLTRIVILAYVIVTLADAHIRELTIVMCGLLSYKVVLTLEYVVQALPAFRGRHRQAGIPSRITDPAGTLP